MRIPLSLQASRYSAGGYAGELPELITSRYNHACAGYRNQAGAPVLLVAGGSDSYTALDSVELLVNESPPWPIALTFLL